METFSAFLTLSAGNSPVNSPHKGQWRGALMFSLIFAWWNGWVNNREAGDLRRHHSHYDVTVIHYWSSVRAEVNGIETYHAIPYSPNFITTGRGPLRTITWPMMTSSNGNIFRVTGHFCGESTGHRWIALTKASDADPWCFRWSPPEQMVKQIIETSVIWDAIALIMTSL